MGTVTRRFATKAVAIPAALALGLALSACGDDDDTDMTPDDGIIDDGIGDDDMDDDNGYGAPGGPEPADEIELNTEDDSAFGVILTGDDDMTLYLFTDDDAGDPTCYDDCVEAWPPYIVTPGAELDVDEQLDESLVDTVEREDGSLQVTYNSHPLYYYFDDSREGDTNGQGLQDAWFVLDVNGQPITDQAT
ncbi:COG4315 family predicted lipoprotein [Natronoglycomyces albus]|uniref:Lipoprotein n=1 Tax=Natronoglycomyces albus TaxID=2811108 RepID=A0A895XP66_9ACTN|nr:hypothetical protein [Natronoglycomyces albus]QSB04306.1 hypothetical protein JQS30_10895 [Natronoglycomyces albus]